MDRVRENHSPKIILRNTSDRRKSVPHKLTLVGHHDKYQTGAPMEISRDSRSSIIEDETERQDFLETSDSQMSPEIDDASTTMTSVVVRTTKRRLFSRKQLSGLKDSFQKNAYPSREEYDTLARSLGMKESSVKQWFQNARAKLRKRGSLSSATKTFYLDRTEPLIQVNTKTGEIQNPPPHVPPVVIQPIPIPTNSQAIGKKHQQLQEATPISRRPTSPPKEAIPVMKIKTEPLESPKEAELPAEKSDSEDSAAPESASPTSSTYQTMTQVSLPADHPFCKLSNTGSGKRKRRKNHNSVMVEETTPQPRPKSVLTPNGSDEDSSAASPSPAAPAPAPVLPPSYYMAAAQYMHAVQSQAAQISKQSSEPAIMATVKKQSQDEGKRSPSSACDADQPLDLSKRRKSSETVTTASEPKPTNGLGRLPVTMPSPLVQPASIMYPQQPLMFPMYPFMPIVSPMPPYPHHSPVFSAWPALHHKMSGLVHHSGNVNKRHGQKLMPSS